MTELVAVIEQIKNNMNLALSVLGLLWIIQCVNVLLGYRLNYLGILPRSPLHLIGIVTAPLLHGNFNHLLFNSIPLILLIPMVALHGLHPLWETTIIVTLISGLGIWLFGRRGLHVGASGLIMGYWSYCLLLALQQSSATTLLLAFISLYYLGGLLGSLIPRGNNTSWEGHLFGFFGGIAAIYWPYWGNWLSEKLH